MVNRKAVTGKILGRQPSLVKLARFLGLAARFTTAKTTNAHILCGMRVAGGGMRVMGCGSREAGCGRRVLRRAAPGAVESLSGGAGVFAPKGRDSIAQAAGLGMTWEKIPAPTGRNPLVFPGLCPELPRHGPLGLGCGMRQAGDGQECPSYKHPYRNQRRSGCRYVPQLNRGAVAAISRR